MNSFVYEVIVYLVEALISGVFLVNMLTAKHKGLLQVVLWCEITVLLLFITPPFSVARIIVLAICELLFTLSMFEDARKRIVKIFFFKELILLTSSVISYACYSMLVDEHLPLLFACRSEDCTYCLLYLLLFSVITSIVFQFAKEKKGVEFTWIMCTLVIVGFGEATAVVSVAEASSGVINSIKAWQIVVAVVCMAAANISIGLLAPYLLRQAERDSSMDYGKELSNMEYRYYEMSVENDKKLMHIRHDIANHIQTIYSLFNNGETQKGMELIDELKDRYANVNNIIYCHNPVINIIIANKKREAEDKGIEVHIKLRDDMDNLPFSDFDLSTVICNLLDNAISGCESSGQPNPRMIVEILQKNQYLVIRVLNSCKINMNIDNATRIETTKSNSQTHGFGMPIIAGIAKKYRGDFIVSAQNGIFTATVVMSTRVSKKENSKLE